MAGYFTLSNGVEVPDLCFGTDITYIRSDGFKRKLQEAKLAMKIFLNRDAAISRKNLYLSELVDSCMKNGCRMFDTSRAYGASEYNLGKVILKYKREDCFITTKLCNEDQFKEDVKGGFEKSLSELGMDYVDLYLMHWPVEDHFLESWQEIEKLYKAGKCRAIGVSNFNIHHFEQLKQYAEILPMVNEIECHPLFTQNELRSYCRDNGIQVLAYTSTARMDQRLFKTCLVPIAAKYNKTVAQVILRWHQQIGNIPIVNSTIIEHMLKNIQIYDFELTKAEVDEITKININSRLRYDPDNCDFRQL